MKRSVVAACAALALLPLSAPARAEAPAVIVTGEDLKSVLESCRSLETRDATMTRACTAYQAGVATGVLIYLRMANADAPFCIPEGTSSPEIDRAILAFVSRDRHGELPAALAVIGALSEYFPCPKASP